MKKVVIALESATMAAKAGRILRRKGIAARVTKADIKLSETGCRYAIEVGEEDFFTTVAALRQTSINYRVSEG